MVLLLLAADLDPLDLFVRRGCATGGCTVGWGGGTILNVLLKTQPDTSSDSSSLETTTLG